MSETTSAPSKPLLFGRYRVEEQLGTGRLATIYHAIDERLQRHVSIHVLRKDLTDNEQLRQRFQDEINARAQVSHPALIEVFDSGESNDRAYMVTEYIRGRPLNAVGVLTVEHALLYTRQVTGAVALCMQRGLPCPPISSSNVWVVGDGQVKLIESWQLSPTDITLDLAHYRAPELTEGQPSSPASTVYALGVLLYELITGTRPMRGDDAMSIAQAHLTTQIPPLSHTRPLLYLPTLEKLINRATSRIPGQRPRDVAAFGNEIDALWRRVGSETQRLAVTPVSLPPHRVKTGILHQQPSPSPSSSSSSQHPSAHHVEHQPTPPHRQHYGPQPLDRATRQRRSLVRSLIGWAVMMIMLAVVVIGSYSAASFVVDQFFAIKLPQITLPDFSLELPEWFPGAEEQNVLVVNINEGLYLREEPGLSTTILANIPNGTRVYQLDEPVVVDNVEWVKVRTETGEGEPLEGWMSLNYLKEPE
jgi:serine/threonine protein kinase